MRLNVYRALTLAALSKAVIMMGAFMKVISLKSDICASPSRESASLLC